MVVSRNPPTRFIPTLSLKVPRRSGTFRYVLPLVLHFGVRSGTFQESADTFLPTFRHVV